MVLEEIFLVRMYCSKTSIYDVDKDIFRFQTKIMIRLNGHEDNKYIHSTDNL